MSDMPEPWVPGTEAPDIGTAQGKLHAPATLRNRAAISAVLAEWLPGHGTVLEIASGSGEHVIHFASQMPHMRWQPSDPDAAAQRSIAAWTGEARLDNVDPPLMLDAAAADWPVLRADAVLCINMVHISPWAATEGLFTGTAALLAPGAPLILYGPFVEDGVETVESNRAFDTSLRSRDPRWGLRDVAAVAKLAEAHGFGALDRRGMPSNNLMLRFVKQE